MADVNPQHALAFPHLCKHSSEKKQKLRAKSSTLPTDVRSSHHRDWSRREHRRGCQQLVRHQHIEVSLPSPAATSSRNTEVILSRAQHAHARLSWAERFARNARVPTASQVTIRLFGVPEGLPTPCSYCAQYAILFKVVGDSTSTCL